MDKKILEHIDKGKVFAIIPARSGSKGVKNKNIRLLNGYPMIAYTIAAAKLSENIDRVIVSTDSEQYAEIARKYGAEVPFLRPAEISGDTSADIEFMQHAINWFYENEGAVPEYWVHLRPTNPLRDCKVLCEAIKRFRENENADSLRSAHLADVSPYKWFLLDKNGYYVTFNGISLDEANKPRQAFPDVYIPDGYVDMLRSSYIIKNNLLHGNKMIGFRSPDSVDVDNVRDMEELEKIVCFYQGQITDYLKHFEKETSL